MVYPVIGAVAVVGFTVSAALGVWVLLARRPRPGDPVEDGSSRGGIPAAAMALAVAALAGLELLAVASRR